MRLSILVREDKRRTSGPVDDPRGENSEDATMPGGIVKDDALGEKVCGGSVQRCELGFDRLERLCFGRTALVVEAIEFFGELCSTRLIFCQEEFDDVAGNIHSARCVDTRREAEADLGGSWRAV